MHQPEVSRPRLVFIRNSDDVTILDVRLQNSGFWTTHLYKCNDVRLINLDIFSPVEPVKAPSTDAIDIDVCTNVLVEGCTLEVNDDAIAIKGVRVPTPMPTPPTDPTGTSSSGTATLVSAIRRSPAAAKPSTTATSWCRTAACKVPRACCGSRCAPTPRNATNTSLWKGSPEKQTASSTPSRGPSSSTSREEKHPLLHFRPYHLPKYRTENQNLRRHPTIAV